MLNFSYLKIIYFVYSSYHPKIIEDTLPNVQKQVCLFQQNYIIDYDGNKTENENKMKSRSHRYDMKRPRTSHGHNHTKYKMCQGSLMVVCIKQHLSNI